MIFDTCVLIFPYLNFLFGWCLFPNFLEHFCNYPIIVGQLMCALGTKVFKGLHFQVLGAKEYQFIYISVHVSFLYTTVSILPGFLLLRCLKQGWYFSFSI